MATSFEAISEFDVALEEVNILIKSASKNEKNELYYKAINKSAILLLAAKFEAFIENIVEEFISKLNAKNLINRLIPDDIKLQHSFMQVDQITTYRTNRAHYDKAKDCLINLSNLWAPHDIHFADLKLPAKFDYGTHGEKEIKRLFCVIGIDDIFAQTELAMGVSDRIDIRGKINSMTHIRNNIIHEDATPSLTHIEINDFLKATKIFAQKAADILTELIDNIHKRK